MNFGTGRTSIHWWRSGLFLLLLLGLAVVYLLPVGSAVWATPQQSPLRQTVPTLTPTPIPSWIWVGQATGNPTDYAPSGMPDFDQKQGSWQSAVGSRGLAVGSWQSAVGSGQWTANQAWTYCGPVAVAEALWWLDSRAEPGHTPPPAVQDGHSLISAYGDWDDHDARNVLPLVEDWAVRLGTAGSVTGTEVSVLLPALQAYLSAKDLQHTYAVTRTESPSFEQILAWVRDDDAVILLLGFWEWQGDRWAYLGGHYVAVAGAEPANRYVAISDPFRDAYEAGQCVLGRIPVWHAPEHTAEVHNDAQYASQDAYRLVAAEGPGGAWALENYAHTYDEVQNFFGQNLSAEFQAYYQDYGGAPITTKLDYAIAISSTQKAKRYRAYLPIVLKGAR